MQRKYKNISGIRYKREYDQMTLKKYVDPFTGEQVTWGDKK